MKMEGKSFQAYNKFKICVCIQCMLQIWMLSLEATLHNNFKTVKFSIQQGSSKRKTNGYKRIKKVLLGEKVLTFSNEIHFFSLWF